MSSSVVKRKKAGLYEPPGPPVNPQRMAAEEKRFTTTRFWYILVVTWIGYGCYQLGRRPFSVSRSQIIEELQIDKTASSMVDSSFLIMYTIGQLLYGALLKDRWSSKQILVGGLFGSMLSCVALSASSSVFLFSVAWGANGAFQAAGWASCMCIITPWLSQAERGMIMGLWGTNMAAGGVVGNMLTSYVIGARGSWREAILVDAGVLLGVTVLMQVFLARHPNTKDLLAPAQRTTIAEIDDFDLEDIRSAQLPDGLITGAPEDIFTNRSSYITTIDGEVIYPKDGEEGGDNDGSFTTGSNISSTKGGVAADEGAPKGITFAQTAMLPGVLAISFSYFFHKLVRYAMIFWLPYYFTKELHYAASTSGYIASALDIGGVAGSICSGILSDRIAGGTRRTFCCVLFGVGMIFSLGIFVFAKPLLASYASFAALASFCCGFFAFGLDSLMTGSLVQDYADKLRVPQHLGAISGFVGGVGTAGSILQGYLTAVISDSSWDTLFTVLIFLTLMAMLLMWQPLKLERSGVRGTSTAGSLVKSAV